MAYKAVAHTERARSASAPLPAKYRGRPRKGGYVHKHDLPTREEAAQKYPHGTVARYILARCRCLPCASIHSQAQMVAYDAKHGPWTVQRVGKSYRDVERERGAGGGRLCRYCNAERRPTGISRHEFFCAKNPSRGEPAARATPKSFVVAHRRTNEPVGPIYATRIEAEAARDRLNRRDRQKLPTDLVSAARVQAHIVRLRDGGMGMLSIHRESGVSASVLDRLMRGMILRTRRGTEAKILAVQLTEYRLVGRDIPAGPTLKMIAALVAVGYRKGWIARECGARAGGLQIGRGIKYGRLCLRADKVRAVKALFSRLWMIDERLRDHVDPEAAERRREEAEQRRELARRGAHPIIPGAKERLARALASWDADEFAVRVDRFRLERVV